MPFFSPLSANLVMSRNNDRKKSILSASNMEMTSNHHMKLRSIHMSASKISTQDSLCHSNGLMFHYPLPPCVKRSEMLIGNFQGHGSSSVFDPKRYTKICIKKRNHMLQLKKETSTSGIAMFHIMNIGGFILLQTVHFTDTRAPSGTVSELKCYHLMFSVLCSTRTCDVDP